MLHLPGFKLIVPVRLTNGDQVGDLQGQESVFRFASGKEKKHMQENDSEREKVESKRQEGGPQSSMP
jgi:hypothetical protein